MRKIIFTTEFLVRLWMGGGGVEWGFKTKVRGLSSAKDIVKGAKLIINK